MRMRLSTAVFYAVVCCSATLILYFMLELTGISSGAREANRRTSVSPEEELAVETLERKLSRLEESIARNRQLVDRLQADKRKRQRIHEGGAPVMAANEALTGSDVIATVKAAGGGLSRSKSGWLADKGSFNEADSLQQCPASGGSPADTDIQMLKVYDKLTFDNPDGGVWKQGWELTYEASQWTTENPLQVFVVPHSHNDPGWIRTFEEYFEESTKQIFNLMIKKLPIKPRRKFIWAEISYLSLWWFTANDESKAVFKKLVKDGQVELVTGGWVMPDESSSHYSSMINQLIEGHEWIKNHIGPDAVPRHGWAIDPFGMSSTMAYILKLNNFDGMLIQRAHYSIKKHLSKLKALEFEWRQTWDRAGRTDILCHLMPFYSYDIPHTCGPDPKICCQFDFRRIPTTSGKPVSCPWGIPPRAITTGNLKERAETLLDQYRKKAQLTQTNVVLAPLGDDFRYDSTTEWDRQYLNYEKLIHYFSSRPDLNVRIQFGTLKDYFDAVKKDTATRALTLPTLSGDFFTYADRDDHYWSGYFTSRPFYKSLDRRLAAHLRSAEIAYSVALARFQRKPTGPSFKHVDLLLMKLISSRRSLALFQHHDGVTGTAKTAVMTDYAIKMITAVTSCDDVLGASLAFLLSPEEDKSSPALVMTLESEERFVTHDQPPVKSRLRVEENGRRVVVYNSLAQSREERVTLRIDSANVVVVAEKSGEVVMSQINPVWMGKTNALSADEFELVFLASIPALGIKTYVIKSVPPSSAPTKGLSAAASIEIFSDNARSDNPSTKVFSLKHAVYPASILLTSELLKLTFDGKTGYLQSVFSKMSSYAGVGIKFIQYGTTEKPDKSGAYLFMPDGEAKDVLNGGLLTEQNQGSSSFAPLIRVLRGPIVSELHLMTSQFIHTVRIIHSTGPEGQAPEIVNEVDITRTSNYELAMHLTTAIQNEDFATDLNGFQLIRRKTFAKLPIQANYYPMPAVALLEDDDFRLTLLGQQPLGVASLVKGNLEVMLDRRLDQDDNRGVGQNVREQLPMTRGTFVSSSNPTAFQQQRISPL
ncbi:Alpha-mannosidase 2 [Hypsibius exemplaris]|uniref:Alpha-mannosidase n=1 Tax=Hypsibius exemplaris TaxID=2072580 RepID=A0A9X6RJS5_HYPEX|nr:Alpha-mannosidase 2 [Hypsibius exemplaris]